jgi:hypothetical protein
VFVSRPTWVAPEFQRGLDGFVGILGNAGLRPRTLGVTDQPSKIPLDEVIQLLDACSGAIILGYPQILATAGSIKNQPLANPLTLATEWNHIEAGLAHARALPLLVVHHLGVGRGVFDHGAIPSFIYEANLTDPAWSLSIQISGALDRWKRDVLTPRQKEMITTASTPPFVPSPVHLRVLELLAAAADDGLSAQDLASALSIPIQKVKYYLDGLDDAENIAPYMVSGRPTRYILEARGRALLVERGLL